MNTASPSISTARPDATPPKDSVALMYKFLTELSLAQSFGLEVDDALLEAIVETRAQITPHLLGMVGAAVHGAEFLVAQDRYEHVIAARLLGAFGETAAHEVIATAYRQPSPLAYELFGDDCWAHLPWLLDATRGDREDLIVKLLEDHDVDGLCRGSAGRALAYGAAQGRRSPDSVAKLIKPQLGTGDQSLDDDANVVLELLATPEGLRQLRRERIAFHHPRDAIRGYVDAMAPARSDGPKNGVRGWRDEPHRC